MARWTRENYGVVHAYYKSLMKEIVRYDPVEELGIVKYSIVLVYRINISDDDLYVAIRLKHDNPTKDGGIYFSLKFGGDDQYAQNMEWHTVDVHYNKPHEDNLNIVKTGFKDFKEKCINLLNCWQSTLSRLI